MRWRPTTTCDLLSLPQVSPSPDAAGYREAEARAGERAAMLVHMQSALGIIAPLFSPKHLGLLVATQPDVIHELVQRASERLRGCLRALLEQGVRAVYQFTGAEYATPPMMSPAVFHRLVSGVDRQLFGLVHEYGAVATVHCHGNLRAVLADMLDSGVDGLHPVESPPMGDIGLAEARSAMGRRCIMGNLQIGDIYSSADRRGGARNRRSHSSGRTAGPYPQHHGHALCRMPIGPGPAQLHGRGAHGSRRPAQLAAAGPATVAGPDWMAACRWFRLGT